MKKDDKKALEEWKNYLKALRHATPIDANESAADKYARIQRLQANPVRWMQYYFPHFCRYPFADFQISAISQICSVMELFYMLVWARSLAKTTIVCMCILFLTLVKGKRNCIYVSNSEDNAVKLLNKVRANLEANQRIINDYGEQIGATWTDSEFKTRAGASFIAIGSGQSPRGTSTDDAVRVDMVVLDDIDTDKDCLNPEIIKKKVDWINDALLPTGDFDTDLSVLCCGNLIAEYCCVSELMKQADTVQVVNIRDESGRSVWPDKNTEEKIDRRLKKLPYSTIEKEFYNRPYTEGRIFKNLTYGKVPPLDSMDQLIVYADPAPSDSEQKKSSFKVVALLGRKDAITYVVKVYCDHVTNARFVEWFYDIHKLTGGRVMQYWIENNTLQNPFYQQVFIPLFKKVGKQYGYTIPIKPDERKKFDKTARIDGTLEPANRLGLLIFNEDEADTPDMIACTQQFKAVSPTYRGAIDAPDCIEGGYTILDQNVSKRGLRFLAFNRPSRRI